MKKLTIVAVVAASACVFYLTGCKSDSEHHETNAGAQHSAQYTCSMHPEVVQDGPGKCPKCGMDLAVKK